MNWFHTCVDHGLIVGWCWRCGYFLFAQFSRRCAAFEEVYSSQKCKANTFILVPELIQLKLIDRLTSDKPDGERNTFSTAWKWRSFVCLYHRWVETNKSNTLFCFEDNRWSELRTPLGLAAAIRLLTSVVRRVELLLPCSNGKCLFPNQNPTIVSFWRHRVLDARLFQEENSSWNYICGLWGASIISRCSRWANIHWSLEMKFRPAWAQF